MSSLILKDEEHNDDDFYESVGVLFSAEKSFDVISVELQFPGSVNACLQVKALDGSFAQTDPELVLWNGAIELARFLIEMFSGNSPEFQEFPNPISTIIELGAGTGFLGIALGCALSPSKLFITDYPENVLHLIETNIALNNDLIRKSENPSQVFCKKLDWFEFNDLADINNQCDVIVGSDVIYDPVLLNPLFKTIRRLLSTNGVFVSCTGWTRYAANEKKMNICANEVGLTKVFTKRIRDCVLDIWK